MDFEPLNDDHAIEEVSFVCNLNRRIPIQELRRVATQLSHLVDDLPSLQMSDAPPMVQFAYLRPDGSATWSVQIGEGTVHVSCTRYSRWVKVWETASTYLASVIKVLLNPETTLMPAVTLVVVDKFLASSHEAGTKALLRPCDLIAPAALEISGQWHSHVGWFDHAFADGQILNQLNVDRVREPQGQAERTAIVIKHVQQLQFATPKNIGSLLGTDGFWIAEPMKYMHDRNKAILMKLLLPEMQRRIELAGTK